MTPRDEWHLETRCLGRRVLVFDQLDSTSTYAAGLSEDRANDGVAVLADSQSAGRGQHGRSWLCPPGTGVLLSLLLFPPPELRRPALLTAWAAVSVCEVIQSVCGLQARIKWPNDVLIQGRKVCGILIEQSRSTVVGIGLNVNQSAEVFVTAGLSEGGSLAALTGKTFDRDAVARQLLHTLDEEYDALVQGHWSSLEVNWKSRLGLLGKIVTAEGTAATYRGRLRDVSFSGVELELAEGELLRLPPEAIRHLA